MSAAIDDAGPAVAHGGDNAVQQAATASPEDNLPAIIEQPVFTITWSIPDYKAHHGKGLCSSPSEHPLSGLFFQLLLAHVPASQDPDAHATPSKKRSGKSRKRSSMRGDSEAGTLALYLLLSNGDKLMEGQFADAMWKLSLRHPKDPTQSIFQANQFRFIRGNTHTFTMWGCHNYMSWDRFEAVLGDLLDNEGTLVVECSMQLVTNFETLGPVDPSQSTKVDINPRDAVQRFAKGDIVAVRAPKGFWLAKMLSPHDLTKKRARKAQVQWFEEVPHSARTFKLTNHTDEIETCSMHPLKIVLRKLANNRFQLKNLSVLKYLR